MLVHNLDSLILGNSISTQYDKGCKSDFVRKVSKKNCSTSSKYISNIKKCIVWCFITFLPRILSRF